MTLVVMSPAGGSLTGFDYQQESLCTGNPNRQRLPGAKKTSGKTLLIFDEDDYGENSR